MSCLDVEALYEVYALRVYRYFRCHLPRGCDAEDLVQTVFERAFARSQSFDPLRGAIEAWLFSIAHNALRDHLRRMAVRRLLPLSAAPVAAGAQPSPEDALLDAERFHALREALAGISARERQVVALRYFGGLRNVDIAKVMGLSEKNVGVILSRALRKLRDELKEEKDHA